MKTYISPLRHFLRYCKVAGKTMELDHFVAFTLNTTNRFDDIKLNAMPLSTARK